MAIRYVLTTNKQGAIDSSDSIDAGVIQASDIASTALGSGLQGGHDSGSGTSSSLSVKLNESQHASGSGLQVSSSGIAFSSYAMGRVDGALQSSTVTAAGSALITAADASAQRTALGLSSAATASTGSSSGTIAAGNDARLNPVALVGGFTDGSNRFSRASVGSGTPDLNFDTGMTLLIVGYRNSTSSLNLERVIINLFNSFGTDGWQLTVNQNIVKFLMIGASIAGGSASVGGSLGVTLTQSAAFALAIEMYSNAIHTSLNGGSVSNVARSGGTTATITSVVGIGADRTGAGSQAFSLGELGEIHLINRALGDAALQSYSLAASTAYSFWPSLTATDRAAAKFSWSAVDGAVVRAGWGPLTQSGFLTRRMPL